MRTVLRLWCRIVGHRWTPWTDAGDERCKRCLDWKDGLSPMQKRANA